MTQSHFHGSNKYYIRSCKNTFARMAELVDALVSNTSELNPRAGSTPASGTHRQLKLIAGYFFHSTIRNSASGTF